MSGTESLPESLGAGSRLLVLFDGTCGFCARCVSWLGARDRRGRLTFVHYQAPGILERHGLSRSEADRAVWLLGPGGRRLSGEDAVAEALVQAGGGWGAAGRLLRVPPFHWVARRGYRVVASRRGLLSRWWSEQPPCDRPDVDCV